MKEKIYYVLLALLIVVDTKLDRHAMSIGIAKAHVPRPQKTTLGGNKYLPTQKPEGNAAPLQSVTKYLKHTVILRLHSM